VWSTQINVTGRYFGPTDVVDVSYYHAVWTTDGKVLTENGTAVLLLSSGGSLRTIWTSFITPATPHFNGFPQQGEVINVSFSPFKINGNRLSYEWHGTVAAAAVIGAKKR
jgi:hypothetical protein